MFIGSASGACLRNPTILQNNRIGALRLIANLPSLLLSIWRNKLSLWIYSATRACPERRRSHDPSSLRVTITVHRDCQCSSLVTQQFQARFENRLGNKQLQVNVKILLGYVYKYNLFGPSSVLIPSFKIFHLLGFGGDCILHPGNAGREEIFSTLRDDENTHRDRLQWFGRVKSDHAPTSSSLTNQWIETVKEIDVMDGRNIMSNIILSLTLEAMAS